MSNSTVGRNKGDRGDNFDFNIASLSGIRAPQSAWVNAFAKESISQSETEKIAPIEAGVPILAQAISQMEMSNESKAIAIMQMSRIRAKGETLSAFLAEWSKLLQEHNERINREENHKSYQYNLNSTSEVVRGELNSATNMASISSNVEVVIDKGSDGDMVLLASRMPAAVGMHEINRRNAWLTGLNSVVQTTIAAAANGAFSSADTLAEVDLLAVQKSGDAKIESLQQNSQTAIETTMLAFLVAGGGLAIVAAPATAACALQLESKVILGAWNALSAQVETQSAALLAGWFSAMWGVGMLYQLAAENLEKYQGAKEGNTQKHDVEFAKNYAEKLAGTLNQPLFETQMLNLIGIGGGKASEITQDSNNLLVKAKLAQLSVALALILKMEEGVVRDSSFKAVVKGEIDLIKNDPYRTASTKRMLCDEINKLIGDLDPQEREQVLYNLLTYMEEDHSVEKMLDQQSLFYEVLRCRSPEESALSTFGKCPLDA